nr:unnamed protein product [Callosobruchus chinensis]
METASEVKQEAEDEDIGGIDKTALGKPDDLYPMYDNDCNVTKCEEGNIDNKDGLMFEQIYVKMEPAQDAEDYGGDTTANYNTVLDSLKNESKYGEAMQMSKIVKVEDDHDDDVKVKTEMVETITDMNSYEFDGNLLHEKLETKDEDDASCIDVAEK